MSVYHLILPSLLQPSLSNSNLDQQKYPNFASSALYGVGIVDSRVFNGFLSTLTFRCGPSRLVAARSGKLKVPEPPPVDNSPIRGGVEIPVTCYQIIGVPDRAEKDEIVKSVMELKGTDIEEGYTLDVVVARQELLMDVRDKLLFEPDYAGNVKEKIPPKPSLRMPWAWLPGALCLLQEVGEERLVLEIGKAALGLPDAKPYMHDLLLSMALAECSIAKNGFEKNKVSQGFEALARAQYLLRSRVSLGKMPLLAEIEESLEELAPACTLELLTMPLTPQNSERRWGAIAALRELLRQGLEVETSCRVQDWPCFLSQALNKLLAAEIVDLLSWEDLAMTRKNKKSLESQNQRVIIDFNCFYMAMIAHIALGFSSRHTDLINKAKTISECLVSSDGIDLKFEEALCSFLLGQGGESVAVERLRLLDVDGSPTSRGFDSTISGNEVKDGNSMRQLLETWLKDSAIGLFPDTRDCSPSLANFFKGEKRILSSNKMKKETIQANPSVSRRSPSFVSTSGPRASEEPCLPTNTIRHVGPAVKQLTPANLESPLVVGKGTINTAPPPPQLKRSLGAHDKKAWESWWAAGNMNGRIKLAAIVGCFFLATFKLLQMRYGWIRSSSILHPIEPKMTSTTSSWNVSRRLGKLLGLVRNPMMHMVEVGNIKNNMWPVDDHSSGKTATFGSDMLCKRQMPLEEAEALVKQWQAIKAEALGPNHELHTLTEVLDESMLAQWKALAESAQARSCYWRFVLLQLRVLRAEVLSSGNDVEIAEIDAVLEEAAELVDESQPKNPSYYSTYKTRYVLKRQYDGSWKFCGVGIESSV